MSGRIFTFTSPHATSAPGKNCGLITDQTTGILSQVKHYAPRRLRRNHLHRKRDRNTSSWPVAILYKLFFNRHIPGSAVCPSGHHL
ncbi:hypothetical protein [Salmonella enterica]|uniref:hypothetical protein n=1 Tax=Salmonella enterica TaxID=28901 RepID=UPI0035BFF6DA